MAIEAATHARQLVARRELELFDRAVTLRAADVARQVQRMVEPQVGLGKREPGHAVTGGAAVAEVTIRALCHRVARVGADLHRIAMIAAVALVATGPFGQQRIGAVVAGFGFFVAAQAGKPEILDVALMIEADGQLLRRKNRRARAVVVALRTRWTIALGHRPAVGRGAEAVREAAQAGRTRVNTGVAQRHARVAIRELRRCDGWRQFSARGRALTAQRQPRREHTAEHEQPKRLATRVVSSWGRQRNTVKLSVASMRKR